MRVVTPVTAPAFPLREEGAPLKRGDPGVLAGLARDAFPLREEGAPLKHALLNDIVHDFLLSPSVRRGLR